MNPEWLASGFEGNGRVIARLTADLTHADSLLVPDFGGNCLNWVLGHLLVSRNRVLSLLGEPPILPPEQAARYETGSPPITAADDPDVLPLEHLLDGVARSGQTIGAALRRTSAAELEAPHAETPPGRMLLGLYWHEAYHIGQMALFRRLAGHTEKVFG